MKQIAQRLLCLLIATFTLHALDADAQGRHKSLPPEYRLTLLGPLDPDYRFFAIDLNNRAELAGNVTVPGGSRAALWQKGQVIEIVDPTRGPVLISQAWGLNDRGDAVGLIIPLSDLMTRPFFRRHGEFIDIGLPFAGAQATAKRINNRRQIILDVGSGSGRPLAYLWQRGTFTPLDPPPGGDGSSVANAINDFGDIAGAGSTADGHRALLWRDGTVEALDVLPATDASRAEDINNRGHIVGVSYDSTTPFGNQLPFVWRDGNMEALPTLRATEGELTEARSINDWGQIVGHESNVADTDTVQPLLWHHGRVHELNQLVRSSDPLKPFVRLSAATVINDRGQIHASGTDSRVPEIEFAYLLTPVF